MTWHDWRKKKTKKQSRYFEEGQHLTEPSVSLCQIKAHVDQPTFWFKRHLHHLSVAVQKQTNTKLDKDHAHVLLCLRGEKPQETTAKNHCAMKQFNTRQRNRCHMSELTVYTDKAYAFTTTARCGLVKYTYLPKHPILTKLKHTLHLSVQKHPSWIGQFYETRYSCHGSNILSSSNKTHQLDDAYWTTGTVHERYNYKVNEVFLISNQFFPLSSQKELIFFVAGRAFLLLLMVASDGIKYVSKLILLFCYLSISSPCQRLKRFVAKIKRCN